VPELIQKLRLSRRLSFERREASLIESTETLVFNRKNRCIHYDVNYSTVAVECVM
jgi:hypothetical protein